ncbi:mitochondrial translation optimization protein [Niveomyces insectorum RCEF 264]|uniref:Mitochondrial translation optimization protein n=1 Tax=Niveomyces insectorum RCEF 264 TaxID=1081102 RepID=A0A167QR85_9HYPO|nr:mitochondrial translation optimization protein [Niveomyces insectorum RCEF 264]
MDESALRALNGGADDDDALRRALALSMGDATGGDRTDSTDDDASDGDGHENGSNGAGLASGRVSSRDGLAEAASPGPSAAHAAAARGTGRAVNVATAGTPVAATGAAAPALSLLSLNRKAMEEERLARRQKQLAQQQQTQEQGGKEPDEVKEASEEHQKRPHAGPSTHPAPPPQRKRKAEAALVVISDDDDDDETASDYSTKSSSAKRPKLSETAAAAAAASMKTTGPLVARPGPGTAAKAATTTTQASAASTAHRAAAPPAPGSASSRLPFARGVVKRTWVRGQPRLGDDITIDEVWQKDALELAVLSSFQWDEDWMLAHLNMRTTKLLLVAYAANEVQEEEMRANVPHSMIRFCFPPTQTAGCMHSKLQLLKFPTHLRIVVPTGNLVPYDWGESGSIENMVFLIDLPKLDETRQNGDDGSGCTGIPFFHDLCHFLKAQHIDESLIQSLRNYDFSETKRYAFVHSIAGSHTDFSWKRTGFPGLARAVKTMNWDSDGPIQVDYVISSLGAVKDDLLNDLYFACQGDEGLKELETRTSRMQKGRKGAASVAPRPLGSRSLARASFRVYFPSQDTVEHSLRGRNGAGTICFQSKWWHASTFPREVLRDVQNTRQGVLLHTKLMLVRRGRLVREKGTGKPKLTCRNWECGVLLPAASSHGQGAPADDTAAAAAATEDTKMLDMFRGTVPVPFRVPGVKYDVNTPSGKRVPWFFMEA